MIVRNRPLMLAGTPSPLLVTQSAGTWWEEFKAYNSPSAWGSVLADVYQRLQYGQIPAPGSGLPPPPPPPAPETKEEVVNWTPQLSEQRAREDWITWAAESRAAIAAAEAAGTYSPEGRLPLKASDLPSGDWWLVAGAVAVGVLGVVLLGKGGR